MGKVSSAQLSRYELPNRIRPPSPLSPGPEEVREVKVTSPRRVDGSARLFTVTIVDKFAGKVGTNRVCDPAATS